MIRYELVCAKGHGFEGWFRDGRTYDQQAKAGKLACPICGTRKVDKAIMAPRPLRGGRGSDRDVARTQPSGEPAEEAKPTVMSGEAQAKAAELMKAMRELRRHVEASADYVGERFAETAREIHHGETPKRNIYGEASSEDERALKDEGIEFERIPWVPRGD